MMHGILAFIILTTVFSTITVHARNDDFFHVSQYVGAERNKRDAFSSVECSNDNCTVTCTVRSFDRKALIAALEKAHTTCGKPIKLTLHGTPFDETFGKADLAGNFELEGLNIMLCDKFSKIEDFAFDKPSLRTLKVLFISQCEQHGNAIEIINERTFKGLNSLNNFYFKNALAPKRLKADGFLTPLAGSLNTLRIEQPSGEGYNAYDPADWLGNVNYPNLSMIILIGSNFSLSERSFVKLVNVQYFHLRESSIKGLEDKTFVPIIKTLKYVDLRRNDLTTLSINLLQMLSNAAVNVFYDGNNWDCSCKNEEFVVFFKDTNQLFDEPICATPAEWANRNISDVEFHCSMVNDGVPKIQPKTVFMLGGTLLLRQHLASS